MRRPLIYLLIAFIAGIITGRLLDISYYSLLTALTLILFFLFVTIKNRWSTAGFFLIISFIFILGMFDIQKQNYFIEDERNIVQYIDKGKVAMEGTVIESPFT